MESNVFFLFLLFLLNKQPGCRAQPLSDHHNTSRPRNSRGATQIKPTENYNVIEIIYSPHISVITMSICTKSSLCSTASQSNTHKISAVNLTLKQRLVLKSPEYCTKKMELHKYKINPQVAMR